jgi:hypothetical protein
MSCWFGELSYEIWVNPIHLLILKKNYLNFFLSKTYFLLIIQDNYKLELNKKSSPENFKINTLFQIQ